LSRLVILTADIVRKKDRRTVGHRQTENAAVDHIPANPATRPTVGGGNETCKTLMLSDTVQAHFKTYVHKTLVCNGKYGYTQ